MITSLILTDTEAKMFWDFVRESPGWFCVYLFVVVSGLTMMVVSIAERNKPNKEDNDTDNKV
jgi:hypothetical protein